MRKAKTNARKATKLRNNQTQKDHSGATEDRQDQNSQSSSIRSTQSSQATTSESLANDTQKPIDYLLIETREGRQFQVKVSIAKMFFTLKSMMEDAICSEREPIKLTQVSGEAFEKMIKFAELHINDAPVPEDIASKERRRTSEIKDIDKQFVNSLSQSLIFELIYASNFIDFRLLLDVLSKTVANMIKNKSVDEIRSTFNIVNDFTSQEEEQLRQENAWIEKY